MDSTSKLSFTRSKISVYILRIHFHLGLHSRIGLNSPNEILHWNFVVGHEIDVLFEFDRYTLNIWDVGGQRTIRSYWRNYFEQTDGLVWVVDSSDLRRLDDCKMELDNLLKEEVFLISSLSFVNAVNITRYIYVICTVKYHLLKKSTPLVSVNVMDRTGFNWFDLCTWLFLLHG